MKYFSVFLRDFSPLFLALALACFARSFIRYFYHDVPIYGSSKLHNKPKIIKELYKDNAVDFENLFKD